VPPHAIAPYYARPAYPVPPPPAGRTEKRTLASLLIGIAGLLIAMLGLLLAAIAVLTQTGDFLNGLVLGLPAIVCGVIAYFLGKSATARIAESPDKLGGGPTAVSGWVIGAVGAAAGAGVTLLWIVLVLLANYGPPPV
jgi:hypothetical protein